METDDQQQEPIKQVDEPSKPKASENLDEKEASQFQPTTTVKLSYLVGAKQEDSRTKNDIMYHTIQSAIDVAMNDSVIKISHGLYIENLVIKDKVLKLEAKDTNSEVYILGQDGPALTVDNGTNGNVTIEWIKFAHKGDKKNEKKDKSDGTTLFADSGKKTTKGGKKDKLKDSRSEFRHKTSLAPSMTFHDGGMSNKDGTTPSQRTLQLGVASSIQKSSLKGKNQKNSLINYLSEFNGKFHMNGAASTQCAILVKRGTFIMRNCKINMNLLGSPLSSYSPAAVPAIIGLNNSTLIIKDCEMRGSNSRDSIGLFLRNCNLLMKNCTLTHFKLGGGHLTVKEDNSTKIIGCKVTFNGQFGLQISGRTVKEKRLKGKAALRSQYIIKEEEEPEIIKDCEFEKNDGPAIQILCPNSCFIKKNIISYNKNGIEVISSDPKIYNNTISKNTGNGILVKAIDKYMAMPIIRNNIIRSNRESGVYCTGMLNYARIVNNDEISFNKLCGIKVDSQAKPHIIMNTIFKNIFQGVLIVDGASAHIEKNEIYENIKANIAFGGGESANTVITNNHIFKGRCEGIFMIEAGNAFIRHNRIEENYDGIIMITSCPEVNNNYIKGNKNSGIMMMKDSRPKIYKNILDGNGSVGLFVRDNSRFSRMEPESKLAIDNEGQEVTEVKEKFCFSGNQVFNTPVALVVERQISEGKKIVAENDILGEEEQGRRSHLKDEEQMPKQEYRIPYTLKEMKCTLI